MVQFNWASKQAGKQLEAVDKINYERFGTNEDVADANEGSVAKENENMCVYNGIWCLQKPSARYELYSLLWKQKWGPAVEMSPTSHWCWNSWLVCCHGMCCLLLRTLFCACGLSV